MKEVIMEQGFQKQFDRCPNCGSDQRFCEQLGNELKARGLARTEWVFSYDVRNGVVMDKAVQDRILAGSSLPGYAIRTDICMECGMLYAVYIDRLNVVTKPTTPPRLGGL